MFPSSWMNVNRRRGSTLKCPNGGMLQQHASHLVRIGVDLMNNLYYVETCCVIQLFARTEWNTSSWFSLTVGVFLMKNTKPCFNNNHWKSSHPWTNPLFLSPSMLDEWQGNIYSNSKTPYCRGWMRRSHCTFGLPAKWSDSRLWPFYGVSLLLRRGCLLYFRDGLLPLGLRLGPSIPVRNGWSVEFHVSADRLW